MSKLVSAIKSGRAFNDREKDRGTIVHLVEPLPDTMSSASFWGTKALCGVEPGRRGNGWHEVKKPANCPKCLKKTEDFHRQEYIGNYVDKKMKGHGLPYGMEYLNLLAETEERAEKSWTNHKRNKTKNP